MMLSADAPSERHDAVAKVKKRLLPISRQVAEILFDEKEYEYQIGVRPIRPDRCRFWMGIGSRGMYTLCFGHGLAFEELSLLDCPPDEIAAAILQGSVRETRWLSCGSVVKVVGRINLSNGRVLTDTAILGLFGFVGMGRRIEVAYAPYQAADDPSARR